MKTKLIFITLLGLWLLSSTSCCKKSPYEVAGVSLKYPNLADEQTLKALRYTGLNYQSADTIALGALNNGNDYGLFFEFQEQEGSYYNYILFIENTDYKDTLTNIMVERKRCEKIKNITYRWNGIEKSTNSIVVD
jgi:hypothetical protein